MKKAFHVPGPGRFAVLMTLGFVVIVAASYVFYRLFERLFLRGVPRLSRWTTTDTTRRLANVPAAALPQTTA